MAEHHIHDEPTNFIWKYVFTVDHKIIAKQFLFAAFFFLLLGGTLAMMIRWQWAFPGQEVPVLGSVLLKNTGGKITPHTYTTIFTMHGLIMIFWAITPLLIGALGNFCIPLMIGARDMAFPRLNMYSFWMFFVSGLCVFAAFFMPMGAGAAGWTTYPPLSTNIGTPGWGQSLVVLGIFTTGLASIMGGINYIVTVIRYRAPGMGWMDLPLTVWGLWLTSVLNVIFVPVLGSGGLLLLMDRHFGTTFFLNGASGNGDPILFQHLFWIFGHPEVYILILPAWGVIGDLLSFFARKPHQWYEGTVYALWAVTIISAVVYGHHMYQTGMAPMLGLSFEFLTLVISIPAIVLFYNWLGTIWKGRIRYHTPMLFSLGVVFVFGLGGLTGLILGTVSTDVYMHDTMWVVGHFHLTMAAATFLGSFAGIYFWFPKMFGRMLDERLGKVHFWGSVVFICCVFCLQLLVGYSGQQRRLYDPYQYTYIQHLKDLNMWTSYFAFALGAIQAVFVINFFWSLFAGKKAEKNPWEVGTLEWTDCESPPVYYNFEKIPTVHHGPHEYSNPEVFEKLDKDWLGQTEEFGEAEALAAAE